MKKVLISMLIFVTFACAATAAEESSSRHEVYAGYGTMSLMLAAEQITQSLIETPFMFGEIGERYVGWGPLSAGYNYYPLKSVSLGLQGIFTRTIGKVKYMDYSSVKTYENYYTLQARVDFHYVNTEYFQMYSGIAGGASFIDTTMKFYNKYSAVYLYSLSPEIGFINMLDSRGKKHWHDWMPAFHLNLLGFRFGTTVAFFVEFGLGINGLANAGISAKF